MIEIIGKQEEINFEKFEEISKEFVQKKITELKKLNKTKIICINCKEAIAGIFYKCQTCKDFNYCEKCEEKNNGKHEHPLIKINISDLS